ncbi:MAG: hypothetical protein ACRDRW_01225 [Pseudonocardiaceae bacterium]
MGAQRGDQSGTAALEFVDEAALVQGAGAPRIAQLDRAGERCTRRITRLLAHLIMENQPGRGATDAP